VAAPDAADNSSTGGEPKPARALSHRTLKKMGEIDMHLSKQNDVAEVELESPKRERHEKWQVRVDANTGHLRISKLR